MLQLGVLAPAPVPRLVLDHCGLDLQYLQPRVERDGSGGGAPHDGVRPQESRRHGGVPLLLGPYPLRLFFLSVDPLGLLLPYRRCDIVLVLAFINIRMFTFYVCMVVSLKRDN